MQEQTNLIDSAFAKRASTDSALRAQLYRIAPGTLLPSASMSAWLMRREPARLTSVRLAKHSGEIGSTSRSATSSCSQSSTVLVPLVWGANRSPVRAEVNRRLAEAQVTFHCFGLGKNRRKLVRCGSSRMSALSFSDVPQRMSRRSPSSANSSRSAPEKLAAVVGEDDTAAKIASLM